MMNIQTKNKIKEIEFVKSTTFIKLIKYSYEKGKSADIQCR